MAALLVFDIGGVLFENAGFDALVELIGADFSDQEIRNVWLNSPAVHLFETGKISPEKFSGLIVDELQIDLTPEAFLQQFVQWPRGLYVGAAPLIASLRQHYTVWCLSNSNVLHWRPYFDDMFDVALASHRTGLVKPMRPAFENMITKTDCPPQEIYFFDDSAANVDVATALGIQARLTYGFDALLNVLNQEGILYNLNEE